MAGEIILRRDGHLAITNIPHLIGGGHSPDGFEWGYGGSGPAELALNILYVITEDKELARRFYQQFKWDFIAKIPYKGGVIKRDEVINWLRQQGCEIKEAV
ncbi:hypothetical protein ciss_07070 [Carboxydothermus islandicus]|uniref:Uncharacterized protein n=1 Tax=Carboxydothermus islandicus TaxID=661089 RepID=A0A1L8D0V1_9THEO|nr:DUF6166 domain-containing protein [Carboxydothermus islandicus]GAV24774.1 hypothetical protein ciss_07070 [Carboxydothermus islandicus]